MKTIRAEKGMAFRNKETKEYVGIVLQLTPRDKEENYEQVPLPTDLDGRKQLFKAVINSHRRRYFK